MPFNRATRPRTSYERAAHILDRHASDARPAEEGQTFLPLRFDDIEVVRDLSDRITYLAEPVLRRGLSLSFTANVDGIRCTVVMRPSHGVWEVRTMWPITGSGVTVYRDGRKRPVE